MPQPGSRRTRYAIVGTGARAGMFVRALAIDHADRVELAALADVNRHRMDVHNDWLAAAGAKPVPTYHAGDFAAMLDAAAVDAVVVATVDRVHDAYIVAALDAGRDVVTEKPMTIDAERCRRILDAQARAGRRVAVAFNYRYNPVHERVREVIAAGEVGEVGSVHFEWLLDLRHGADYFRRWHRDKANSGGLMVHKASHHFDLVNWWIGAVPEVVFGLGRRFFYGPENGRRHGLARDYDRAHGAAAAADDPFALRLADSPALTALYLDAEHEDGYHRDQNVFGPGITIEDDMAVAVRYDTGATLTYHLTAYAPWEGYRVMVNGSRGRLELEVAENRFVDRATARTVKGAAPHGEDPPVARLLLRPFWSAPVDLDLPPARGGHGGADERMLAALFGAEGGAERGPEGGAEGGPEGGPGGHGDPDPLGRRSTQRDGALSLLTGLAANRSFETGTAVHVRDLLEVP
jgi:predicted dehydrogenase